MQWNRRCENNSLASDEQRPRKRSKAKSTEEIIARDALN